MNPPILKVSNQPPKYWPCGRQPQFRFCSAPSTCNPYTPLHTSIYTYRCFVLCFYIPLYQHDSPTLRSPKYWVLAFLLSESTDFGTFKSVSKDWLCGYSQQCRFSDSFDLYIRTTTQRSVRRRRSVPEVHGPGVRVLRRPLTQGVGRRKHTMDLIQRFIHVVFSLTLLLFFTADLTTRFFLS